MKKASRLGLLCVLALLIVYGRPMGADQAATRVATLQVTNRPVRPLIENRGGGQIVNLDLLVSNHTAQAFRLVALRLSVFDRHGKLELQREISENGRPPALAIVGNLTLPAAGATDLFQPFTTFDRSVDLATMRFTLLFDQVAHSGSVIPLTADATLTLDVHPERYAPASYCLPLSGLLLVHDGHDLLSHHRRYDLTQRFTRDAASAVSANLYAYDFVRVSATGALYQGPFTRKESWLTYGATIRAPEAGTVVGSANDVPENTFSDSGQAKIPPAAEAMDPNGFGNYVEMEHPDGRVSWLLHMQPGSLAVHTGDSLRAGQLLGKVGFSGDSLFPHLHYNVTNSTSYPSQGVPSYFRALTRRTGTKPTLLRGAQIDSGDLLESGPCPSLASRSRGAARTGSIGAAHGSGSR